MSNVFMLDKEQIFPGNFVKLTFDVSHMFSSRYVRNVNDQTNFNHMFDNIKRLCHIYIACTANTLAINGTFTII